MRLTVDEVIALVVGVAFIYAGISIAVRTFMMPGAEPALITKLLFRATQEVFNVVSVRMRADRRRQDLIGLFAPAALLVVLFFTIALMGVGYAFVFHAAGAGGFNESVNFSASAISTLGFAELPLGSFVLTMLTVFEAMSSAAVISLLIGYLPNLYSDYTTREQTIAKLMAEVDDGTSGPTIVAAFQQSPGLDQTGDVWSDWADWFTRIGAGHSSITSALFIRSPAAPVSWVSVAGAVLDACSLLLSTAAVDDATRRQATRCLSSGAKALDKIATRLGSPTPGPDATWPEQPISVTEAEFDAAVDALARAGVEVAADRAAAWTAFARNRVRYDRALLDLCRANLLTEGTWSGDRPSAKHLLRMPIWRAGKL